MAYLVNQYPKVSHSFVRREILALERKGLRVERFAQRGWDAEVVDPEDVLEKARTRYLLRAGPLGIVISMVRCAARAPLRFMRTLRLAVVMSCGAEKSLPFHLIYFAEACCLRLWLAGCGARHLHAHFGTNSAEIAMLAHELGGPPYSFTAHGPEEFDKAPMLHLGEKIRRAAFVVAISSFGRSQMYRWVGHCWWPKIHVVHCGIERAFHEHAFSAPSAAAQLVCVGRLCEQKGQLLLLQAARRLVDRQIDFKLVLAGDGEMRAELESVAEKLELQGHVRITGWISSAQVRDELLAARAMVLPSFAEGLPVVIMEAMALGRPVLTTYVAGIPELVRDGDTGWLFPAGDVEALADAMAACLAMSADELTRVGSAARHRVLSRHDIDLAASKLAALFDHPPTVSGKC